MGGTNGLIEVPKGLGSGGGRQDAGRRPGGPAAPASFVVAGALSLLLLALLLWALGAGRWLSDPAFRTWQTVAVAVLVQATPFLLLGTVISGAVNAFVPSRVFARALPRNRILAVPVAGAAGAVLPGCECASVPVAQSLIGRGVEPSAAFAFLLSAPAINPIVLASTSVAFPHAPMMVLARLVASLGASAVMGWLWLRFGKDEWLRRPPHHTGHTAGGSHWEEFRVGVQHDFLRSAGFVVIGAAAAATFNVLVPRSLLSDFTGSPWLSVIFLAVLAVLLSVCSEADAFLAASLAGFSNTARLAFLVIGPMVDLKLIALQAGTFSRAFAVRFCSVSAVVAVFSAALVGWWLL
jgi:uncharacterized protein